MAAKKKKSPKQAARKSGKKAGKKSPKQSARGGRSTGRSTAQVGTQREKRSTTAKKRYGPAYSPIVPGRLIKLERRLAAHARDTTQVLARITSILAWDRATPLSAFTQSLVEAQDILTRMDARTGRRDPSTPRGRVHHVITRRRERAAARAKTNTPDGTTPYRDPLDAFPGAAASASEFPHSAAPLDGPGNGPIAGGT
jgi:hypothetical protein